jgi:hypothetical protein
MPTLLMSGASVLLQELISRGATISVLVSLIRRCISVPDEKVGLSLAHSHWLSCLLHID